MLSMCLITPTSLFPAYLPRPISVIPAVLESSRARRLHEFCNLHCAWNSNHVLYFVRPVSNDRPFLFCYFTSVVDWGCPAFAVFEGWNNHKRGCPTFRDFRKVGISTSWPSDGNTRTVNMRLPPPPDLIHGIFWNHGDRRNAETQIYWIDALAGKILMAR